MIWLFFLGIGRGFIFSYGNTDHLTNTADRVGVAFLFQILLELWHLI